MSSTTVVSEDDRTFVGSNISRLPSPTPSEDDLLKTRSARLLSGFHKFTKRPWYFHVIVALILTIVIVISVYETKIIRWLAPSILKIRNLHGGFIIPIVIFIIISIPPLFGQEILGVLVGLVWGLGIGFAITAAGTLIGETLIFFAFKYFFRSYGDKLEKRRVKYAALARIIRDGGLLIAVVVRYSVIPGHFVTALFAVCGVNLWVFLASAVLSLPLHFVTVFIGHASLDEEEGKNKTVDDVVKYTSLAATVVVTYAAMYYLGREMDKIKADLILQRRTERQAKKLSTSGFPYDDGSSAEIGLMETGSEYAVPVYGTQYTPVNRAGSPFKPSPPAFPSSSHDPGHNTLTPYGGGYVGSGRRCNLSTGSLSSQSSDETPIQSSDDHNRESFDIQHLSPRSVQSSIP